MADISNLAQFGDGGLSIPSFVEIRDAYAAKMKEIYGNDIDISSASADGQYIMMESLILNNIYQGLGNAAKMFNPVSATGRYLDILALFCGLFRQQPTYSKAQVYVWFHPENGSTGTVDPDQITCIDKNGNLWKWINPGDLETGTRLQITENPTPLEFTCETLGQIYVAGDPNIPIDPNTGNIDWDVVKNRPAYERGGDIYQTIENSDIWVYQKNAAIVGKGLESDSDLRTRMNMRPTVQGVTLLDGLENALFNIDGIEDVYVYANATPNSSTQDDGAVVAQHNVYVAIWKDQSLEANDNVFNQRVAQTIYENLTPGILTESSSGYSPAYGTIKSQVITVTPQHTTTVYWKNCTPATTAFRLKIMAPSGASFTDVDDLSNSQKTAIKDAVRKYLNNLPIKSTLIGSELCNVAMSADFRSKPYNLSTYFVTKPEEYVFNSDLNAWEWSSLTQLDSSITKYYYDTNDIKIIMDTIDTDTDMYCIVGQGAEPANE